MNHTKKNVDVCIEKGTMGWWACVSDKKKNFDEIFLEEISKFEDDDICYLVDCHI